MQLANKSVLVTGAQQGIGRAIAVECAAAGANVAINWLDDEAAAREVAGTCVAHGRRAISIQADMAKLGEVREMIDAVVAEWTRHGAVAHRGPKTVFTHERLCQLLDPFGNLFGVRQAAAYAGEPPPPTA